MLSRSGADGTTSSPEASARGSEPPAPSSFATTRSSFERGRRVTFDWKSSTQLSPVDGPWCESTPAGHGSRGLIGATLVEGRADGSAVDAAVFTGPDRRSGAAGRLASASRSPAGPRSTSGGSGGHGDSLEEPPHAARRTRREQTRRRIHPSSTGRGPDSTGEWWAQAVRWLIAKRANQRQSAAFPATYARKSGWPSGL